MLLLKLYQLLWYFLHQRPFGPKGKVPKDRSWKAAKSGVMAKVDKFLDDLIFYDKENIHEACLKAVQPYLDDPEFDPDFIRAKSSAAAGMCAWVINIVTFYRIFCDVAPKRNTLAQANADLAAAQEKCKTDLPNASPEFCQLYIALHKGQIASDRSTRALSQ